jgi:hypothetical protein
MEEGKGKEEERPGTGERGWGAGRGDKGATGGGETRDRGEGMEERRE